MHGEMTNILQDTGDWVRAQRGESAQTGARGVSASATPVPHALSLSQLRYAFQTKSNYTLAISGSGHAGMEAAIANLVEPGDVVLVGVNGIWGERVVDLTERYGGDVRPLTVPLGSVFSLEYLEEAFRANPGAKLLFLVHGESSSGTLQPVEGVGALCKKYGALFLLDTVCTLAGVPLTLDEWGVDATYSGTQKCLGAPPGLSPFSMNERARARVAARKTKPASYYFDAGLVGKNWGVDNVPRAYHHTLAVNNIYQLREAVAMLASEGLEAVWARHAAAGKQLQEGLQAMGLELFRPAWCGQTSPPTSCARTSLRLRGGWAPPSARCGASE
jgi:alanine-glyoxylate transaminase / serine-glyoxylate transaminase / serine-pyruvate transaminase